MHSSVFTSKGVQINNGKRKEIIVLLSFILVPDLKFTSPVLMDDIQREIKLDLLQSTLSDKKNLCSGPNFLIRLFSAPKGGIKE